mgnify:CR=1 FL=1
MENEFVEHRIAPRVQSIEGCAASPTDATQRGAPAGPGAGPPSAPAAFTFEVERVQPAPDAAQRFMEARALFVRMLLREALDGRGSLERKAA